MIDYRALYSFLFNGITDVIEKVEKSDVSTTNADCVLLLKELQADAEEMYLSQEDWKNHSAYNAEWFGI